MVGLVIVGYLCVGLLWGCTNPILKHYQLKAQQEETKRKGAVKESIWHSLYRFLTNPMMLLPYAINQSGSVVYYFMLSREPVTIASPICNSLTFVITAVTGSLFFNEKIGDPLLMAIGVTLVVFGTFICMTA